MALTIELPDDLAERFIAAGVAPEEVPTFAVALIRKGLDRGVATAGEGLGLSNEEEGELHQSILEGIQAGKEGRTRPLSEYATDFEMRHGIVPSREDRAAA